MYKLYFLPRAERFLKKIRDTSLLAKFKEAFTALCNNPYAGQAKHGNLSGIYGLDVYYMGTNYEIAYRIYEQNERSIVIILTGTRENFYKELSRLV